MKFGVEFGDQAEVMPPRTEEGYFFAPPAVDVVRLRLQELGYRNIEFPFPYVQTIYFAELSGKTPQKGHVRLRRYSSKIGSTFNILGSDYYLEGKVSGGSKERIVLPVDVPMEILVNPNSRDVIRGVLPNIHTLLADAGPMFPVVATEWPREHYILDELNRATVDTELIYFGFLPGENVGHPMGTAEEHRIEFKSLNGMNPTMGIAGLNLIPIPRKWHEEVVRSMYRRWLADLRK